MKSRLFILTILLVLVIFPVIANVVKLVEPRDVKISLYFGRPRTSLLVREDIQLFSDTDVETVRGLTGVISGWRSIELWLREGKIIGLEFDKTESDHLPLLTSGRYPNVHETQTMVLSNDTATKLGIRIGSQVSVLGENFTVVGLTVRHEVFSPDRLLSLDQSSFVSGEYGKVSWVPIFTALNHMKL